MTHLVMMHDIDNNVDILHRAVACKIVKRNSEGSPSILKILPTCLDANELKSGDCVILVYINEEEFKEL